MNNRATKLYDIDNNYNLYGLGVFPFILDVVDEVMEDYPEATKEEACLKVGATIMQLLQHRIIKTNKEKERLRQSRNARLEHDRKELAKIHGIKVARVIIANSSITYMNMKQKPCYSLKEAIEGIGQDEYNDIVYRAVNGLEAKGRVMRKRSEKVVSNE